MDIRMVWALFFSGVCALKFHPKNIVVDEELEVAKAAKIADLMCDEFEARFPKE